MSTGAHIKVDRETHVSPKQCANIKGNASLLLSNTDIYWTNVKIGKIEQL